MLFQVRHVTTYRYSRPVRLGPHWLRLRPRWDGGTELLRHELDIQPPPAGRGDILDLEGNLVTRAWFLGETDHLTVTSRFQARTPRADPYDYLAEPMSWEALYPPELGSRLGPWISQGPVAPTVLALARDLRAEAGDAHAFLRGLNEWLYREIKREIRDTGHAHAPGETLRRGKGACRDLAVLFMAACRSQGLAARFVSGYQQGAEGRRARAKCYMHAWAEVYLPGGGWRGFDPTHGLAVGDRHVAVAAAANPVDAAPLDGGFLGEARSTLQAEVRIHVDE